MTRIIILGANGATSKVLIPKLLKIDHIEITLFSRKDNNLQQYKHHNNIKTLKGDANHLPTLKEAFQNQDIIISTLGDMDLDLKTQNIIRAMNDLNLKRLISINAGGIYDELPSLFNEWDKQMVGETRPINLKAANLIESSGLDYTILRPVWLTNKLITEYTLTQKGELFKGTETSRASIAEFIALLIKKPHLHLNENLGISQPNTDGDKPKAYR